MPVKKISVSLPAELVDEARCQAGKAGLSAFIAAAVEKELRSHKLKEALDWFDRTYGPPSPEAEAWAKEKWQETKDAWASGA
jgi:hypothetical protein